MWIVTLTECPSSEIEGFYLYKSDLYQTFMQVTWNTNRFEKNYCDRLIMIFSISSATVMFYLISYSVPTLSSFLIEDNAILARYIFSSFRV